MYLIISHSFITIRFFKMFDTVSHRLLLFILEIISLGEETLALFVSYLMNKLQQVMVLHRIFCMFDLIFLRDRSCFQFIPLKWQLTLNTIIPNYANVMQLYYSFHLRNLINAYLLNIFLNVDNVLFSFYIL